MFVGGIGFYFKVFIEGFVELLEILEVVCIEVCVMVEEGGVEVFKVVFL